MWNKLSVDLQTKFLNEFVGDEQYIDTEGDGEYTD